MKKKNILILLIFFILFLFNYTVAVSFIEKDCRSYTYLQSISKSKISLSMNALLLKAEITENRLLAAMQANKIKTLSKARINNQTKLLLASYEKQLSDLYMFGYREIPKEIERVILAKIQNREEGSILKDKTPNPFADIKAKTRYKTLSNGLFDEIHEAVDTIQYYHALLNTKTQKIIKLLPVEADNEYKVDPVVFALSVDPLSDKYPSISPYAYCAWNPVMLVDPDGRDWFENENTGAVYHNNKLGKNDAGTGAMKGEGWKHLGANGMFTKQDGTSSDVGLMGKYGGKISSQNIDGSFNTELMLDGGGKAELFMNDMGYSLVPKEYSYKNDAIVQNFIDEMGNQRIQTIDNGSQISNVYSSQYINNSLYCHETILTIGQEKREILNFNSTRITSTDKIQANYNSWPSLNGTAKQIALEIHSTFGSDIIGEFRDRMIKMFKSNKSKH